MPALIAAAKKIAASLVSTEQGRKFVLFLILIPFILIMIVISIPFMIFGTVPAVDDEHVEQVYLEAVRVVEMDTRTLRDGERIGQEGITIDVEKLLAINMYLLEQDFEKSTVSNVTDLAQQFIYEIHSVTTETVEQTCEDTTEIEDENGNIVTIVEEYDCSYEIEISWTHYFERRFADVLNRLANQNLLPSELVADVLNTYEFLVSES